MKRFFITSLLLISMVANAMAQNANFNGSWKGTLDAGPYSLTIVFNIHQTDDSVTITWDSPDQGAFGLPATATINGNELNVDMPESYATYKGTLVGDTLDGKFTQMGGSLTMRMTLKDGNDEEQNTRPQEAAIEADTNKPYRCEDVTFTNEDITFSGTLTIPNTGSNFPAVVLVAGSGPHDRDENVFGHRPFLLLADALSRNGFVVLRYDERGVGDTKGGDPLAPTEPLATDAMAALRYLKTRPEVNAAQAGIMGHSEGGMIAIMNAAKHPDEVAYIVSLAGTGVSGLELGKQQTRLIKKTMGQEYSDEEMRLSDEMLSIIAAEKDSVTLRNKLTAFYEHNPEAQEELEGMTIEEVVDLVFITSCVIQYDPTENLKLVKCPMLAINGTLDCQVSCKENLEAIANLVPHATVRAYEGLNHFFQTCDDWVGSSQYALIHETMNPQVINDIIEWLLSVVKE